jgi:hypothetical protein
MATIGTAITIPKEQVKIRWREPYVSAGLNQKFSGVMRPGIYRGFEAQASGTPNNYINFVVDSGTSDSVAVVEDDVNGYSTTVRYTTNLQVDLSSQFAAGATLYGVIEVDYQVGPDTTGEIKVVDTLTGLGAYIQICKIIIPAAASAVLPAYISFVGLTDVNSVDTDRPWVDSTNHGYSYPELFDRAPTQDQKDAMDNANSPSSSNPFATESDTTDKAIAESTLSSVATINPYVEIQMPSGIYFVGTGGAGTGKQWFELFEPGTDNGLTGSDDGPITVQGLYKTTGTGNPLIPNGGDADSDGFYDNTSGAALFVRMDFTATGDSFYNGTVDVYAGTKKTIATLDVNALLKKPVKSIEVTAELQRAIYKINGAAWDDALRHLRWWGDQSADIGELTGNASRTIFRAVGNDFQNVVDSSGDAFEWRTGIDGSLLLKLEGAGGFSTDIIPSTHQNNFIGTLANSWKGGYFDAGTETTPTNRFTVVGSSTTTAATNAADGINSTGGSSTSGDGGHGVVATGGNNTDNTQTGGDGLNAIGGTGSTGGRGVYGEGAGASPGVYGKGGAANGAGVQGLGQGAGDGVRGTGGPTNGIGLWGLGIGTGQGLYAIGGNNAAGGHGIYATGGFLGGYGIDAQGTGNFPGVIGRGGSGGQDGVQGIATGGKSGCYGYGGPAGGWGIYGDGTLNRAGVKGVGDQTGSGVSGSGVEGTGGTPDGKGVLGTGTGTGAGVHGDTSASTGYGVIAEAQVGAPTPTRSALRLVNQNGDPSTAVRGDISSNGGGGLGSTSKLRHYNGQKWEGIVPNVEASVSNSDTLAGPSTSFQTFASKYTIPAYSLRIGSTIRIKAWGTHEGTSGVGPYVQLRLRISGTNIVTSTAKPTSVATTGDIWSVEAWGVVREFTTPETVMFGKFTHGARSVSIPDLTHDETPVALSASSTHDIDVQAQFTLTPTSSDIVQLQALIVDIT